MYPSAAGPFWWTSGFLEQHYYNLSQRITANLHFNFFSWSISTFHPNIFVIIVAGGRKLGFDLWWLWVRPWPIILPVLQPAVVQDTPVIFNGALLPDERTRWVCLLNWNCIKEKRQERRNKPGCHWKWDLLHGCLAWTDERSNATWQHSTMSNGSGASHCFPNTHTFYLFFFKPQPVFCNATIYFVSILCTTNLLMVCMCLCKQLLGITVNPSLATHRKKKISLGPAEPRYQMEEVHFLSLWAGSWTKG